MKRPTIAVSITDTATGVILDSETRYAWNAACRASEAMMRRIARIEGEAYSGWTPESNRADRYRPTVGDTYTRQWTGDDTGHRLTATITVETAP